MALEWSDEQKGLILGVINSHGWIDLMKPILLSAREGAIQLLNSHVDQRPTPKWGDEYYKGQRAGLDFAIGFWEQNLKELIKTVEPPPTGEDLPGSGSPYADAGAPSESTAT